MKRIVLLSLVALMLGGIFAGVAIAADGQKLQLTGVNYTKFLWGNRRYDGSMYNFTTIPGEGYGDNGQGTEFELLLQSKPSSKVEVTGRIKSRFNQNQWTNWGGFGGSVNDIGIGGAGGEFDPRSNQYIKLRGLTVNITPGYWWLNRATIGSSDFGMYDPFTVGKIRYIDRDNGKGIFLNGSFLDGQLTYDASRISLSRLWSGPYYRTYPSDSNGDYYGTEAYTSMDATWTAQFRYRPFRSLGIRAIYNYLEDLEHDMADTDMNDGRDLWERQRNTVFGAQVDWNYDVGIWDGKIDLQWYHAAYRTYGPLGGDTGGGWSAYTAYPLGEMDDDTIIGDFNFDNILGSDFSIALQGFSIGADYVSVMAARRETDVLLTEGHEGAFYFPEADNASWKGTSVMGYGGFLDNAQQVATTNVDNEFTDFDEPLAQTAIGWKGITVVPELTIGDIDLAGEFSYIDYNTNWQMWGMGGEDGIDFTTSPYVMSEPDAGFGSFRNAYMPFQDKTTMIYMVKANWYLDIGEGIDLHGKIKYIDEEDLRINEVEWLSDASVMAHFGAGDWAPFDSLDDDDKQLDMYLYEIGAGYQLSSELYLDVTYQYYDVELLDGNTGFQGNRAHRMAGGDHKKNAVIADASYMVGGAEFGLVYQYAFGAWTPDFGDGWTPTEDADGNRGFVDSWGVFQSAEKQEYTHARMKAYMKVLF